MDKQTPWPLVHERTIPTERPPLVVVPTFVDRGVSRGQRGGPPTVVKSQFSRPEPLLFFQVAPHLSSQRLSGPRSRPIATQKIW
jgi:hypothetical protein